MVKQSYCGIVIFLVFGPPQNSQFIADLHLLDLVVGENEGDAALDGGEILGPEVVEEVIHTVRLGHRDLERVLPHREAGEARPNVACRWGVGGGCYG